MIKVCDLKKSFQDIEILKGISIDLEEGKTNLIIGQSGSGKTVFVKCLLGLLIPDFGQIFYKGIDSNAMNLEERRKLRAKIGVVFQGSALFDSMSVEENVMFPLKMFTEQSPKEMKENVNRVLERVKLESAHQKYPSELSGGMQKRVAIARAIVNNPDFLFCDEPNSGLDPKTAIVIDQLIQELTKEYSTTTVINTHDMNSVMEIGEKIIFLKNGFKQWEGSSNKILTTTNESVLDFVYSSNLFKKIRSNIIKNN
ncbi:ABC transporter ATP-binding protein [Bacteroidetes bacterium endosymbiont of Geopemphigus sp.]|uniref:ABC transporter ATP-binding protein n=1 Tax=Bacteroidetes bacterium endosymbiont of Geopemphigus sp. TaxID=2047937 RepID=UPI000CD0A321|nr:ATP-binding cassette domain-containing protein [Bacteroidetes bacterium endosymbiont of Geopemphigus sp.]